MKLNDLVRSCVDETDQWHQHYLTIEKSGRVELGQFLNQEYRYQWDRWLPLEGLGLTGRSEWFALRHEHDESMTLCRLDCGEKEPVRVDETTPLYAAFLWLYVEGDGMTLRPAESQRLDAIADEIDATRLDALSSR